jgi:prepilin-type N-terminal cleavage/methylation domain-containing protein/prepilin-type processing-associated H-X9-DG protein
MLTIETKRRGLTLIEVLVVIAILGVLMALMLPAIHAAREAMRRSSCSNNLHQLGVALQMHHEAQRSFPLGSDMLTLTEHSWSTLLLPYLEEQKLFDRFEFTERWDDEYANKAASETELPIFICPSAGERFPGKTSYGGIIGTNLTGLKFGYGPTDAFGCGTLITLTPMQQYPVSHRKITDGLSKTIAVSEAGDRPATAGAGHWACGRNCLGQLEDEISVLAGRGVSSDHAAGANVLFADGHVTLITEELDRKILGAYCTRNGGEIIPQ